jgi:hypothetical protein
MTIACPALAPTKSIYDLMPADVFEDVNVPLLLKDAAIVNIHVKLPVVGQAVDLERGMLGVFGQKAELLVRLFLNVAG